MEEIGITQQSIRAFREFLLENEKAPATVQKYVGEAEHLREFLAGEPLTKRSSWPIGSTCSSSAAHGPSTTSSLP